MLPFIKVLSEMSIFDWDAYCDVVEKVFNEYLVCVTLVLTVR